MKSEDLYNDINTYNYQSSCAYYSFSLNLKSYDGSCDYIGCSDESAINFIDFVTQSDNSLCDYPTAEIFCGQSFIYSESNISKYGRIHKSDNIFSLQLETETTLIIPEPWYNIYEDNMYNLIYDFDQMLPPYNNIYPPLELTLGPGKYLFLKEIYGSLIGNSSVIDCLGCQDDVACNFNQQANISSDLCNYVENDCDYCLDGIIYSSDINNNNICDIEEIMVVMITLLLTLI